VFVCYGNICRSPFAAALFERLLPPELLEKVSVGSAGFIGPNRYSPRTAIVAAQKYGVDLSRHRSSVINSRMLKEADLIVVMAPDQARGITARLRLSSASVMVLGDLDPLLFERRAILDPWNGSHEVFERSYSRLYRCVAELSRLVAEAYGVSGIDPVAPPSSSGNEGAEALAEQEA
jgi:protein-tyrosine phosphatase